MTKSPMVLAALAALAATGCTAPNPGGYGGGMTQVLGPQGPSTCFFGQDVNNFNIRDRQTAYVSTRQGYVFRLDAPANCFNIGTESLSIERFNSVSPRVCVGGQASVAVSQFRAPPLRCVVRVSGPIRDSAESGLRSRQD